MLSPAWAFALPAAVAALAALAIFACATAAWLRGGWELSHFGNYWVILAGSLLGLSHIGFLFAASTHVYGRRAGYRLKSGRLDAFGRWITLETMLIAGGGLMAAGVLLFLAVLGYWSQHHFFAIRSALPAATAATLLVIGAQNALGGFLLAVVNGNEAEFLKLETSQTAPAPCAAQAQPSASRTEPVSRVTAFARQSAPRRLRLSSLLSKSRVARMRLPRFLLFSALCAALNNALVISFVWAGLGPLAASLLAFPPVLAVGFALHSLLTFETTMSMAAFWRYALAMAMNFPAWSASLFILCDLLGAPIAFAAPATTLLLVAWNFRSARWALKRPKSAGDLLSPDKSR